MFFQSIDNFLIKIIRIEKFYTDFCRQTRIQTLQEDLLIFHKLSSVYDDELRSLAKTRVHGAKLTICMCYPSYDHRRVAPYTRGITRCDGYSRPLYCLP